MIYRNQEEGFYKIKKWLLQKKWINCAIMNEHVITAMKAHSRLKEMWFLLNQQWTVKSLQTLQYHIIITMNGCIYLSINLHLSVFNLFYNFTSSAFCLPWTCWWSPNILTIICKLTIIISIPILWLIFLAIATLFLRQSQSIYPVINITMSSSPKLHVWALLHLQCASEGQTPDQSRTWSKMYYLLSHFLSKSWV